MAIWLAQKYPPFARDSDAVFAEAKMGLVKAAEKHDPGRGTRFSTLAVIICRHAVFAELKRQRRIPVAVPRTIVGKCGDETERKDLPKVPPPDVEPRTCWLE